MNRSVSTDGGLMWLNGSLAMGRYWLGSSPVVAQFWLGGGLTIVRQFEKEKLKLEK
jgi:hypothetical protein